MTSAVVEARNGVDVPTLFATLDAVDANRGLAESQFRATNHWVKGTHSRTTVEGFFAAGDEHTHLERRVYDADHPAVLVGADQGSTPIEYVLVALASCLTAGVGNIASARGIDLYEVESTVVGDINLLGLLGLDDDVRNGYQEIRVNFKVRGNASPEKLAEIVEQSKKRSAVFDIITGNVPVSIGVDAA